MPVDPQRPSQFGGERTPAGTASSSDGHESLLQRLSEQLEVNERRHADSLRDVHIHSRRSETRASDTPSSAPSSAPLADGSMRRVVRHGRPVADAAYRAAPSRGSDGLADPFSDDPFREPRAMDFRSSPRGHLDTQFGSPLSYSFHAADLPWDVDSADALSRLYEGTEAAASQSHPAHPAPLDRMSEPSRGQFDQVGAAVYGDAPASSIQVGPKEQIHTGVERFDEVAAPVEVQSRLVDVAARVEAALHELRPHNRNRELNERFDRFETRLTSVLDNVASRPHGGDGLRRVEAHVGKLASQMDQTRADLARLDRIEEQLAELRDKLSDDHVVQLFGSLVPTEEDLVRFAEEAASRVATRYAPQESRASRPAVPADKAAPASSDEQFEALYTLLSSFIDESRRSDHVTTDTLETVQTALQQVLDRVEALEAANPEVRGSQGAAWSPAQVPLSAPHAASQVSHVPIDFVPPRHSERDYNFADQNGPVLQPIADLPEHHNARSTGTQMPQHDRFLESTNADYAVHSPQSTDMPRGPMDRKQMIEMARRAAETARVASAQQAASASGKQSKDRLGIVAAGKQSKSAVRPGLLIAASVSAFLLAGSFFILGPKLRSSNAPPAARPTQAVVEPSDTSAPRGAGPEINEDAKPAPREPVAPERRSMVPVSPDREASAATREAATRNVAASEALDMARFGIAVQSSPSKPSADELIRVRQRARIASLSERTGYNAAQTAAAVVEPAALVAAMPEAAPAPEGRHVAVAPEARTELALPPIQIGPSSLRAAAASGDASAQFEVAARFAEGKGVTKSFEQAAIWYQRAAAQGLSQAQYRLATLYERGLGVKADLERARVWYNRAADQGNVKAMHNLAVLSTNRELGAPDYAAAARYFERAAEHGLGDSQFNLGVLYENGQGVQVDRIAAYKWYGRAALAGDRDAERRRDQLRMKLDSASITKGEKLISEWRPRPSDPIANEARTAGDAWKQREAKVSQ